MQGQVKDQPRSVAVVVLRLEPGSCSYLERTLFTTRNLATYVDAFINPIISATAAVDAPAGVAAPRPFSDSAAIDYSWRGTTQTSTARSSSSTLTTPPRCSRSPEAKPSSVFRRTSQRNWLGIQIDSSW